MKNKTPYEVSSESGGRQFLSFETEHGANAWPWHALRSVSLSADASSLKLQYTEHSVEILGSGLGTLADLAMTSRLKTVRVGETDEIKVREIRMIGVDHE